MLQEEHVDTQYGKVHCVMTGTPRTKCPVILTYHDVGLNRRSYFSTYSSQETVHHIFVAEQDPTYCNMLCDFLSCLADHRQDLF